MTVCVFMSIIFRSIDLFAHFKKKRIYVWILADQTVTPVVHIFKNKFFFFVS